MKILKKSGNYLEGKRKTFRNLGIVFLILAFLTIFLFYICGFMTILSFYFFKKSWKYSKGIKGESIVTESLKEFDNNHYLVNDVLLPNSYGNIDHVFLAPNGVFLIETKHISGRLRCYGDKWYHSNGKVSNEIKSPSKQVKWNGINLRRFLEKEFGRVYVNSVLVFTNDIDLDLKFHTVPVLKIDELNEFIKKKWSNKVFSKEELEKVGSLIVGE